tara:strand:+ start:146 stop:475 length:330 start_codon:yes stop_codon:yes gene_type:complete
MKSHPTKQLKPTMLDNAGLYHKIKKGIPRVLGVMASMFPLTRGIKLGVGLRTLGKPKYPTSLPKGWNKSGSKEAFKHLKGDFGPSKETINYLKNYSKDFGPIFKEMGKK